MSGTKLTDSSKLIKAIKDKIDVRIVDILAETSTKLLHSTDFAAEYYNVTGNTFTSYSCGIYIDKKLVKVLQAANFRRPPTRKTLRKYEWYDKLEYWDGDEILGKPFMGDSGVSSYIGSERALRFLKEYVPTKDGYVVCMCTGTYYSEMLEVKKHLNVLTETMLAADNILIANLKEVE